MLTMPDTHSPAAIAQAAYEAFVKRDRRTAEALFADDFRFTSPYDDHIDKATYFARCWPFGDQILGFDILSVTAAGNEALVVYECRPKSGKPFRNAERLRVEGRRITEVEVYFGALPSDTSEVDSGAESGKLREEAEIRQLLEHRGQALQAKDSAALSARVAPDTVAFDVVNPLQYVGVEETRKRAEDWLGSFDGPIGYEIRDLHIAAHGDVAFARCLTRISGNTPNGPLAMWIRTTMGFRKVNGEWMIVHEHNSVPFDPATGAASMNLQP